MVWPADESGPISAAAALFCATMAAVGLQCIRTFHDDDVDEGLPGSELGGVEYAITRGEWRAANREPNAPSIVVALTDRLPGHWRQRARQDGGGPEPRPVRPAV
jgi:hypothetical protein